MSRRTTRSTTRSSTFQAFLTDILPIIVSQEKCWVNAADVASLQATCSGANQILRGKSGDAIWKALAVREWPDVGNLIITNEDDAMNDDDDVPTNIGKYSSYHELYKDYPRVWLTMEAAKIKSTPKWTKTKHMNKHGIIECGKCGCNCGRLGSECPGIPIESKVRFDRRERLPYYDCRADVPDGEGYIMSGGEWVVLNHFCEPCFERMVELEVVEREDYDRVAGKSIYDETTDYVINEEGRDPWKDGVGKCFYCDGFFTEWGEGGYSWQKNLGVDTDDAMVVIANALIDPNCSHKHLNIAALHFNESYSEKAYKAMAYALSINTSLLTLTMAGHDEYCCDYDEYHDEYCCDYDEHNDEYCCDYGEYKDKSNGLFVKALKHNDAHKIFRMDYCRNAFGKNIEREIKALLKPRPVQGR